MSIPNLLTIIRILLIPIYILVFYSSLEYNVLYSTLIFIIAGITDILDGYIARKFNMITKLGTALDPIADKLMTFAILITFNDARLIPEWILIIIGLKEISLIVGGIVLYFSESKKVVSSDIFGKIATVSFYVAIISTAFKLPFLVTSTLLIVTVSLNILAFLNYFILFKNFKRNKNRI